MVWFCSFLFQSKRDLLLTINGKPDSKERKVIGRKEFATTHSSWLWEDVDVFRVPVDNNLAKLFELIGDDKTVRKFAKSWLEFLGEVLS